MKFSRLEIFLLSAGTAVNAVPRRTPLEDRKLPWGKLKQKLSTNASLIDTDNTGYAEQCLPEFENSIPLGVSQQRIVDKPDGLCMMSLYCGFDECLPIPDTKTLSYRDIVATVNPQRNEYAANGVVTDEVKGYVEDINNPQYDLSSKVVFPHLPRDVVAIVDFANKNDVELSVKASGHNYAGASTKKDTLLVNMSRIKKESPTGVTECLEDASLQKDLSNQACNLARARKLSAYVRVSGGEHYGSVYQSVSDFNKALPDFKYLVVGGAAPTVTPMGWTLGGGLSSTTGGRLFGFGADQVLQIEAVLPNGHHVRFGPTETVEQDEFLYPRTTVVSGVCDQNPYEEDESKSIWGSCPSSIDFDDLWFAFLGGGGGTYGIITSMSIQLHDYLPLEYVAYDPLVCGLAEELRIPLLIESNRFFTDFLLDPLSLGVSEEESNACGVVALEYALYCYGKDSGVRAAEIWKEYWLERKDELSTEFPEDVIIKYAECLGEDRALLKFEDYFAAVNSFTGSYTIAPTGQGFLSIDYLSGPTPSNVLIPKNWIVSNKDKFMELLSRFDTVYWAFGENTAKAQDNGVVSLSDGYRQAGVMILFWGDATHYWDTLLEAYDNFSTDASNFPSYIGSNHPQAIILGPQKDDFTKQCNFDLTLKERKNQCVPAQTIIYGAKNQERLEKIKEKIDPNYILDCTICIGNNRSNQKNLKESKKVKSETTFQATQRALR